MRTNPMNHGWFHWFNHGWLWMLHHPLHQWKRKTLQCMIIYLFVLNINNVAKQCYNFLQILSKQSESESESESKSLSLSEDSTNAHNVSANF